LIKEIPEVQVRIIRAKKILEQLQAELKELSQSLVAQRKCLKMIILELKRR
jgi:hypothetical protein